MTKIMLPDNVNPYSSEEVLAFMKSAGLELLDDYEDVFQYLNRFTCQEWFDEGQKLFLYVNTYDRYPGRRFVVSYDIQDVLSETPIKTYIVNEYKIN